VLRAGSGAQTFDKRIGGFLRAPTKREVQNELCVPLDCHKTVGIPDAVIVRFHRQLVGFFLADVAPNLINLHVLHRDVDQRAAHQLLALFAGLHQDLHQRVDIEAGDALRRTQAGFPRP